MRCSRSVECLFFFQICGSFLVLMNYMGENNSKVCGFNNLQVISLNIVDNISMSQEQSSLHKNTFLKIKLGSCILELYTLYS